MREGWTARKAHEQEEPLQRWTRCPLWCPAPTRRKLFIFQPCSRSPAHRRTTRSRATHNKSKTREPRVATRCSRKRRLAMAMAAIRDRSQGARGGGVATMSFPNKHPDHLAKVLPFSPGSAQWPIPAVCEARLSCAIACASLQICSWHNMHHTRRDAFDEGGPPMSSLPATDCCPCL